MDNDTPEQRAHESRRHIEPDIRVRPWPEVKNDGMSLRDYFAGQAMMRYQFTIGVDYAELSGICYQIADAMLKERAK